MSVPFGDMEIVGDWTWIRGSVSGTAAQMNGMRATIYWVSTSQLGPQSGNNGTGRTCRVSTGTVVRNTPGGVNQGMTGGTGVTFQFSSYPTRTSNGVTWRLGAIRGTSSATNTWGGRLLWVPVSQLTNCTG